MDDSAIMVISTLDGDAARDVGRLPQAHSEQGQCTDTPIPGRVTPGHATHQTHGMPTVREDLREQGVSAAGTDILLASWKPSTAEQYQPHVDRWHQFCVKWNINALNPSASHIINFLTDTFQRNVGFDSVNTARGPFLH